MSRPHLPNTYNSPPGEWRYRVPETGYTLKRSNWPELQDALVAHYKASGYPLPPDLFENVEAFICANAPDFCEGGPVTRPKFDLAHTFSVVVQGTRTLSNWLVGGRTYVPQLVAEKRASICVTCVYNTEPQGCTGCNSKVLAEAVQLVVGKRATSFDSRLHACRVCACQLKAKVHLPLANLLKYMPAEQQALLPPHCWLVGERELSAVEPLPVTSSLAPCHPLTPL